MNDSVRTMLSRLVALYGVSIAHDPTRCEGLLRDTCQECNREIFVLTQAIRQHIPDDLLNPRHTLPLALTQAFLVKRLEDELGFSGDVARWAVTCWSEALGRADAAPTISDKTEVSVNNEDKTDPALREQWASDLDRAPRSVRLGIIRNLAGTLDTGNVKLLIRALGNDDWAVRSAVYDVLVSPENNASSLLIDSLHQASEDTTWRITLILGALKEKESVETLIHLLDGSPVVRAAAIWSLGEIRDKRAASPLMALLRNTDTEVVKSVESALRQMGE